MKRYASPDRVYPRVCKSTRHEILSPADEDTRGYCRECRREAGTRYRAKPAELEIVVPTRAGIVRRIIALDRMLEDEPRHWLKAKLAEERARLRAELARLSPDPGAEDTARRASSP